jgi:glycosyltransferase involved in cell wall biosynthesis
MFSVIVPLYNKAPYVKKTIESVCAQTYRNFECVVVDDGSTDGSLDVVRSLDTGDCALEIISQSNSGVAAARNNGVKACNGEYVVFLDADDWWEPEYLEEMNRLIQEYPDAGLYASNYVYYKPGKTHVALNLERGYMNYPEAYLHGEMPVWTGAACMPRKVFDEMGGFPNGIKLGEDFLLWAKSALHYKVAFCEKPLAYYNNDVPASLRATRNLHAPQYHMIFNLDEIEKEVRGKSEEVRVEWMALLDKLRVIGLMDYWLSDEYHENAAAELAKVDWSKQPKSAKARYEEPICLLKAKRRLMQIGSYYKQQLIRLQYKK